MFGDIPNTPSPPRIELFRQFFDGIDWQSFWHTRGVKNLAKYGTITIACLIFVIAIVNVLSNGLEGSAWCYMGAFAGFQLAWGLSLLHKDMPRTKDYLAYKSLELVACLIIVLLISRCSSVNGWFAFTAVIVSAGIGFFETATAYTRAVFRYDESI